MPIVLPRFDPGAVEGQMVELTDESIREVVNPPPRTEANAAEAAWAAILLEYDRGEFACAL